MTENFSEKGTTYSEIYSTSSEMTALHIRMALGNEALKIEQSLSEVAEDTTFNPDSTTETVIRGSNQEITLYWERRWQEILKQNQNLATLVPKERHERELSIWVQEMVSCFKNPKNKVFAEKLRSRKIGGIDFSNFTEETARQTYERYSTNLNQFIDDIISSYNSNYEDVLKDIEAIHW